MQPGESGKIPVKLNVGRHSGRTNKAITVLTNVPGDSATVKLSIQGEVWMPVDVQPQTVNFSRLNSDSAKDPNLAQKVTIVNNMEQNANITDVRSANPLFRAETKVIEPGKKWEMTIGLTAVPQLGTNNGTIEMSTGITEMPTLTVPVSAFVVADVEVTPPNLTLRSDQPVANRQLFIRNNSKTPIKISDLKTTNESFKLNLEETQPGTMFKLNVDIPADYQGGPGGDRITFKTDNPTAKDVTIPIVMSKPPPAPASGPAGHVATPSAKGSPSAPAAGAPVQHQQREKSLAGPPKPPTTLKPSDIQREQPAGKQAQPTTTRPAGT